MIKIMKVGEVSRDEIFARTEPKVDVTAIVADIIADVKENGDKALLAYCEKFDKAKLDALRTAFRSATDADVENAKRIFEEYKKK